ncbi:MAG: extracellular solute-binding protein [Lentisphaerae bacterium]|nr:extracellular solute-binding protein [Lentisphaerota bacterium]MBT4822812.1 extracellular solute-binding protein [Lentisphaerota bacterium]MBT5605945.1 extracellular solute-binding protein [Lentisphaerota bacterium]MBT7058024.1 extracellular solute-binding protein [Lentisphaerota bacterium]MBT7848579.1 extracellular solute-binding protein [Lentisphaerota bacterium]
MRSRSLTRWHQAPLGSLFASMLLPLVCAAAPKLGQEPLPELTVTVTSRFNTQGRLPKNLRDYLARHPNVRLKQWEGIRLPQEGARASLAMAMAANIGADIFETDIRQAVAQGLAYPLTEWIGQDGILANGQPKLTPDGTPDRNGQIDADESKWPGWMHIKPFLRQAGTVDGIPYSLPIGDGTYVGILYSKSMIRKAGLDPEKPPMTWEEFIHWARLLYIHETKTPAVELIPASWAFAPWVATAGSSIVVQDRVSPTTGKPHTFNEQATDLRVPETGEDLSRVMPKWRCNVAHPDAVAAVGFYHRLRWAPWIVDPENSAPLELSPEEAQQGKAERQGRTITFNPTDVIEGCVGVTNQRFTEMLTRFGRSLAMHPLWASDMTQFETLGVQADDLGMFPFPAMNGQLRPVLQNSACFFMIGKDVRTRGGSTDEEHKAYRDIVWNIMTRICAKEGSDESIRRKVAAGQAKFLNPRDLERLGLDDYLREFPPENLQTWARIEAGQIQEVIEPFMGRWLQFRDFYQREVVDRVLRPSGREFDYAEALRQLERDANRGIMFERPPEVLDKHRPRARVIAVIVAVIMLTFLVLIIRDQVKRGASLAGVHKGWMPWLLMAPALLSIGIWKYYPLLRGLVMAFQDYKIAGKTVFVGLNNFIAIALDPNFYHYIWTTFRFVFWNLILAFFTPIILAFLLTEIPRLKIFFRTLFFLPQMTSGLVVTLMWKEMFEGTASGTLNRLLSFFLGNFGFQPVDWLGSASTVMACVIVPGVWAHAGMGSLIYLAALKSVPDELYEAASIDGAGILRRIWAIALPTIAPLIMINFVGSFIHAFQNMANIFLLTFGGPGKETMVMGMAIWQEAYVNLRFSLATSYAWILGSILISFTYLQLRILRRVDFRQAKGD